MYAIACAFRWGVALVGVGIAHPVMGPSFRYKECIRRRRSDEAAIAKEADMWPRLTFFVKVFCIKGFL